MIRDENILKPHLNNPLTQSLIIGHCVDSVEKNTSLKREIFPLFPKTVQRCFLIHAKQNCKNSKFFSFFQFYVMRISKKWAFNLCGFFAILTRAKAQNTNNIHSKKKIKVKKLDKHKKIFKWMGRELKDDNEKMFSCEIKC